MTLHEAVAARQDALLATLCESIRIPSVEGAPQEGCPYGPEVRRALDHILDTAKRLGLRCGHLDHHVGWCEIGGGDEMIGVLGHLDVVPAGEGWSFEPFGGKIQDGKVFGRGSMDDKGPVVASLYALAAIQDLGLPLRRRIRLLFGTNEETGSRDMKYYVSHGGELPLMGFTPDGEYPVINGEKGIINVTLSHRYQQEGPVRLVRLSGGSAPNVVPASAWAEIACPADTAETLTALSREKLQVIKIDGGVRVEAEGVSAHGSTPEQGENAIGRLVQGLIRFPLSQPVLEVLSFLADKIGMETDGAGLGIRLRDEISGGLTFNWGTAQADESSITLAINYRYPVTCSYADCAPILRETVEAAGFQVVSETHKASLYVPADRELVKTLLDVYAAETGLAAQPKSIGGGTYAKSMPNIVAFGPIFPGDEVREHKPDEFIEVDKLMKNAQIFAQAMYQLAK